MVKCDTNDGGVFQETRQILTDKREHQMNDDVILTCAVTGGSDIIDKHPGLPSSPADIASAAISAAICPRLDCSSRH